MQKEQFPPRKDNPDIDNKDQVERNPASHQPAIHQETPIDGTNYVLRSESLEELLEIGLTRELVNSESVSNSTSHQSPGNRARPFVGTNYAVKEESLEEVEISLTRGPINSGPVGNSIGFFAAHQSPANREIPIVGTNYVLRQESLEELLRIGLRRELVNSEDNTMSPDAQTAYKPS
ncbi:hypothetical protein [Legionella septentrionalis]|uniref:Uncharacterized protein n=1 Tax=Legionella septentrionalis TaxID=2498109 RepID=A0A433JGE6_9GAMM|nr:hypothetical protein [Legionella septentrionalis]RUQ79175.1 hypothetical protein EKM59_11435 [Legionella septentrionalis]